MNWRRIRPPQYLSGRNDYSFRREYRDEFARWVAAQEVNLFVTLSFAQRTILSEARSLLGHWLARIDNHFLGRGWARKPSVERTHAIMFFENTRTNLHCHSVMHLPSWGPTEDIEYTSKTL